MSAKLVCLASLLVLVLGLALPGRAAAADPDLAAWWAFDEGGGTAAQDASGNGHHGTITGAQSTAGRIGPALAFDEVDDRVTVPDFTYGPEFSIAFWFNVAENGGTQYQYMISHGSFDVAHSVNIYICEDGEASGLGGILRTAFRDNNDASNSGALDLPRGLADGNWHHYALTVSTAEGSTVYIDGFRRMSAARGGGTFNPTTNLFFGSRVDQQAQRFYGGLLDDIRLYSRAMTAQEIPGAMKGQAELAFSPDPAAGAADVPWDTALSWTPAASAAKHNVYLGTDSANVTNADLAAPLGVLVGTGQTATTYEPAAPLTYGQTYYWRVDEVNAVDQKATKGDVWSFTVEPYAYPIRSVTATASSVQPGMGPEKTVDGSGLNAGDQHSTELKDMWLSGGTLPNWIQFTFDKAYKLHELWIWNSNQIIESVLGFGAKAVTIEYSVDGSTWTALAGVPEFAKATGLATYTHDTTVRFGGVSAQYVKLTIDSTWSGMAQASLSEVRFFSVPVQAREPAPANAATGVGLDAVLRWRPGRGAASHRVFVGTDRDAVAGGAVPAQTAADHNFSPAALDFGTTYYWKVDEVNAVTYPGDVWSFTTREYAVVDDFESYDDNLEAKTTIFDTWIDGLTNGLTNSVVGHAQAPFAERTILHGGKQSMPLEYNNIKTPYYSETEQTWTTAQDWTGNGATDLSLWFRGRPVAFLDKGDGAFTLSGGGHDIWDNADDFRFVYKRLTGDGSIVTKVESLINTNAWAKAGVMIRDSLEAGSPMAYAIQSLSNGAQLGWRPTLAAAAASAPAATGVAAPHWVKLTRTGNVFTAQHSADGKTWTDIKNADGTVASTTVNMATGVYIGLCVTSHNAAAMTTAQFSGTATTGNVTGAWQVAEIGDDPQPANRPDALYVVVQDSAGKSKVVRHPDPAATGIATWQQWQIPLSEFTSAGVKMTTVKKLGLGVGDRNAPKPGGAGLVYLDDIGFGHSAK